MHQPLWFDLQKASMSSSERPFVSGIRFEVSHIAGAQHNANSQKVQAEPRLSSITGVSCPTRKLPIHRERVASAMALPRIAFGKISAMTTQHTGPNENAKQAMKAKINNNIQGPEVIPKANSVPMIISEATTPPTPKNNNGRLPHLSTVNMATKVNTTLTSPMVT